MNGRKLRPAERIIGFIERLYCRWPVRRRNSDSACRSPRRICIFGTSLTEQGGWVPHLQAALRANQPNQSIVVLNLGRGGEDTQAALGRIGELFQARPDVVLVEFATNDAYAPYAVSPRTSVRRTMQLVRTIRRGLPGTRVYLVTMNPVIGTKAIADHPRLSEYYRGYRHVAAQLSIDLIDVEPAWGTPTIESIPDGTHPTLNAHLAVTMPVILSRLIADYFRTHQDL